MGPTPLRAGPSGLDWFETHAFTTTHWATMVNCSVTMTTTTRTTWPIASPTTVWPFSNAPSATSPRSECLCSEWRDIDDDDDDNGNDDDDKNDDRNDDDDSNDGDSNDNTSKDNDSNDDNEWW